MSLVASSRSPFGPVLDGPNRATHDRNVSRGARKIMGKADSGESFRDSLRATRDSILAEPASSDVAKPIVEGWVDEVALRRRCNRKAAYAAVAWLFDCSESWVRRLLSGEVDGFDSDRFGRIVASAPHLRSLQRERGLALIGDDVPPGPGGADAP